MFECSWLTSFNDSSNLRKNIISEYYQRNERQAKKLSIFKIQLYRSPVGIFVVFQELLSILHSFRFFSCSTFLTNPGVDTGSNGVQNEAILKGIIENKFSSLQYSTNLHEKKVEYAYISNESCFFERFLTNFLNLQRSTSITNFVQDNIILKQIKIIRP